LESIGTLASGIAHDLNNILTPILMSVGILRTRPIDSESMKLINAIEGSAERGAGIVRQVLTFARGVAGDRMILQPRHLVNELIKILSQSFPKNIAVRTQIPKDLWMVSGDATQIHQVLLNLCVNARDAMPEGGSMLLVADNVVLDTAVQEAAPEAKPGAYVMLQVTDTGTGIEPETIKRMYDPFFTTKDVGKGTGLGLSTARGIVKNHGGFMLADSTVGQGTTFKVFLPASLTGESPLEKGNQPEIPRGNGQLILVVDDEAPVRAAATRTLEGHGYQVYTAEDGADALALYFQRRSQIQLVLTDYTMEQMDGMQLAQALKRLDPHVRIIVSSGQCGEDKVAAFRARGVNAFLDKPYKPEALLQMIHEELQRE
jgi:CheY-like chemotaxis protein